MTEFVVDASVAVKWVVGEEHSDKAALLLQCARRHAPKHWQAEAVNALWSKVFKGELTASDAENRVRVLLRAPSVGAPMSGLMARAFAISVARSVTIYDSLYVALAEALDIRLVTADRALLRLMAGDAVDAKRMIFVGDFDLAV